MGNSPIRDIPTIGPGQTAQFCHGFVNVQGDDLAASQTVTRHLIALGHKRIAFLTGPLLGTVG